MRITNASLDDAGAIAAVRVAAANRLTREFGDGHWSAHTTDAAVARDIKASTVLVARDRGTIVGTLTLQTKRPLGYRRPYFTPARSRYTWSTWRSLPSGSVPGLAAALLTEALHAARASPAHALRLDAYEGPAGSGGFYRRCGYTAVGGKSYRGVPLLYFELMTGVPE